MVVVQLWGVRSVGEYECAGAGDCDDETGRPLVGQTSGPARICYPSQSSNLKQTVLQLQRQHLIVLNPDLLIE